MPEPMTEQELDVLDARLQPLNLGSGKKMACNCPYDSYLRLRATIDALRAENAALKEQLKQWQDWYERTRKPVFYLHKENKP